MKLIVLSGYSRSGKSYTIKHLVKDLGYKAVSTSQMMHAGFEDMFKQLGVSIDSYDKTTELVLELREAQNGKPIGHYLGDMRQPLIAYIESGISKIYGRKALGAAAASSLIEQANSEYKFVYECFNFEEYLGFMEKLRGSGIDMSEVQELVLTVKSVYSAPELDEREHIVDNSYFDSYYNDFIQDERCFKKVLVNDRNSQFTRDLDSTVIEFNYI